jgi:hypothetical protein
MISDTPLAAQIRIELLDIKPPIWRRVLVPRNLQLGQLHRVIQPALACAISRG